MPTAIPPPPTSAARSSAGARRGRRRRKVLRSGEVDASRDRAATAVKSCSLAIGRRSGLARCPSHLASTGAARDFLSELHHAPVAFGLLLVKRTLGSRWKRNVSCLCSARRKRRLCPVRQGARPRRLPPALITARTSGSWVSWRPALRREWRRNDVHTFDKSRSQRNASSRLFRAVTARRNSRCILRAHSSLSISTSAFSSRR